MKGRVNRRLRTSSVSGKAGVASLRQLSAEDARDVVTTTAAYRMITNDLTRALNNTAKKPQAARETAYYLANIEKVKSIDDFMGDKRLYNYVMKAFGLQDMAYAKAFIRKALEGGVDDPESFANRLSDTRYKDMVATFNFVRHGELTTVFERTRQGTVDRYMRQTLEEDAGGTNEGVRLALYFERKASSVTSPYGLLADPALLKVAQTALGLPATMSLQSIEKQAATIEKRLDIEDLKDPAKVKSLLTRFTALWELQNPTSTAAAPSIIIGQSTPAGVNQGLLAALQNLKLGGN
jgi:hypothetical protein